MRWKLVGSCRLARISRTPLQRGAVTICTLAFRYSCASLHPSRECLLVWGRASAGWSRQRPLITDPTAILDTPCKPGPTHSASVSKSRATNVACLFEQKAYACHTTNDESHRRRTDARSNAWHAQLHCTKRKEHANAIPKSRLFESLN